MKKHSLKKFALRYLLLLAPLMSPSILPLTHANNRAVPLKREKGEVHYQLTVDYKKHLVKGQAKKAMAINGSIPAPTLYFKEGEKAIIDVTNNMKEETSVHWHGILLPNYQDGVAYLTSPPIRPGKSHRFEFTLNQPPGTYWYHSHTALQEQDGLFGALVIEAKKKPFAYDRDLTLVLSDWTYEKPYQVLRTLKRGSEWYSIKKGTLITFWDVLKNKALPAQLTMWKSRMPGMDISDIYYPAFLINGAVDPSYPEFKPGERVRLRLINASASTYFWLTFAKGEALMVSADGVNVQAMPAHKYLHAVAETYDFLLTIPTGKSWELKATAQDGSGVASAIIGQGELLKAPAVPKPDMIEGMKAMAKSHAGGHKQHQHKPQKKKKLQEKRHEQHQHQSHHKEHKQEQNHKAVIPVKTGIQKSQQTQAQQKAYERNPAQHHGHHEQQDKERQMQRHTQYPTEPFIPALAEIQKSQQTQAKHNKPVIPVKTGIQKATSQQELHERSPAQHHKTNKTGQPEGQKTKPHHSHKKTRTQEHQQYTQQSKPEHTQHKQGHSKHHHTQEHSPDQKSHAKHYYHLKSLEKTSFPKDQPVREITMNLTGNMWRYVWSINGKTLSAVDKIKINRGEVTRIILNNKTMMHHPMHLHGHFFRVLNGRGDYSPLKHTVDVPPMEQVTIEFDSNEKGDWFFHCHVLYHMKGGMSRIFSYGDARDPRLKDYPVNKVLKADRHWYKWGELDLMSHRLNAEAVFTNTKNRVTLEGVFSWFDHKYQLFPNYELELGYERFVTDFFRLYAKLELENEEIHHTTEDLKASPLKKNPITLESLEEKLNFLPGDPHLIPRMGIKYLLPYFFDLGLSVSPEDLQVSLDYELMLLSRLEFFAEWEVNVDFSEIQDYYKLEIEYEWQVGLEYILSKNFALTGSYDNHFGWGAGLNIKL